MEMLLTEDEIKVITDKVKTPCLVGIRYFEKGVQQATCKFINGEYCQCHATYEKAIIEAIKNNTK